MLDYDEFIEESVPKLEARWRRFLLISVFKKQRKEHEHRISDYMSGS